MKKKPKKKRCVGKKSKIFFLKKRRFFPKNFRKSGPNVKNAWKTRGILKKKPKKNDE